MRQAVLAFGMSWDRGVRSHLFQPIRPGYAQLQIPIAAVKTTIFSHGEFTAFNAGAIALFDQWQAANRPRLTGFGKDETPQGADCDAGGGFAGYL